jgi:hypothetical protein
MPRIDEAEEAAEDRKDGEENEEDIMKDIAPFIRDTAEADPDRERRLAGLLDDVPAEIRRRSKPKRPAEELKPSSQRWIPLPEPSSSSSSSSLTQNWETTGTTGAGVELLKRLKRSEDDPERQAFIAERVEIPLGTNKNVRKQMAGKNLKYDQCDARTKALLDKSRLKEWKKWMDFDAGVVIEGDLLRELLSEGASMLPTQWIETDQNEHLKRPGQHHVPDLKSRLVACGQYEDKAGLRTDSPTADVEALNLVCSFAACKGLSIKSADVRNAYFTADPIDRLLLLRPPKGGIPGRSNDNGNANVERIPIAIAANKPIYGTPDAGRGFYKRLKREAEQNDLQENRLLLSLYTFQVKGDVQVMLAAHVDDVIWAATPEYEWMVQQVLGAFELKKVETGKFRFCGREYEQYEDFSIKVTCRDNTEKILPINYQKGTRPLEGKATEGEISQMRSVIGSLAWIARQCRPELTYDMSKLQSVVATAQVKHLEHCNRVLHEAIATSDRGIFFKAKAFEFERALLLTITDASWAGEELVHDDRVFPRRSQYGRILALADPNLWDKSESGYMHIIGYKSALIKRLCRSTFRAETQGMVYGTEAGVHMRAVLAKITGQFKRENWEEECAKTRRHLWLTDCQSLHDYLVNPVPADTEDKRLQIDLEALREYLWFDENGFPKDDMRVDQHDQVRWIDTSAMVCDPLTKSGTKNFADRLVEMYSTGWFSSEATAASQIKKMKQQKARLERTLAKADSQTTTAASASIERTIPDRHFGDRTTQDAEDISE